MRQLTDLLLFLGSALLLEQRLLLPLFFLALAFFGGSSSLRVSLRLLLRLKLALVLSLLCALLLLLLRLHLAVSSHWLTAGRRISGALDGLTRRVLLLLRGGAGYHSLTRGVL